jgi:glutathione S-transferase
MKLYYSPAACSLAIHILLREIGQPFDLVKVDTKSHKTADGGDYYAVNPKGYVPLLELEDGTRLTEGPVIARYLCDTAKREDLMPAAGTMARYRVEEWQNYVTSEIHKSFSPVFSPAYDATAKQIFIAGLRKKFGWVSEQIAGRDYLTGNTYTAADAYFFTVTNWAKFVDLDISDLAPVQAYLGRIATRPAVQAALKAEGLTK